jgi:hypothetical protein
MSLGSTPRKKGEESRVGQRKQLNATGSQLHRKLGTKMAILVLFWI